MRDEALRGVLRPVMMLKRERGRLEAKKLFPLAYWFLLAFLFLLPMLFCFSCEASRIITGNI